MKLEKELIAPVFNLKDVLGRDIDLNTYKDKKLLIGFFRHAGCPFCNIRVHALSKLKEALKPTGFEMIFFFESPAKVIARSTFHAELAPIPIISDPEKIWYKAYGLEDSGFKSGISHLASFVQTAFKAYQVGVPMHAMAGDESIKTMPAEFLIDEGLVIKKVHYSERLNDRMKVDDIKAFAEYGWAEIKKAG
jgi:peroxiredoxin